MKFGLSKDQYILLDELLIKPLKSKNASVYVFGSRARGNFHPFSDIDILFVEDKQNIISPSELSRIKENLEDSKLEIKVDLVRIEDLAKSYLATANKDKIRIE
jgi:predicted nucleotidyltransferase